MEKMRRNERFEEACLSKLDLPPDICEKINKWAKSNRNMLTFCGNPGLGKTYLCYAMKNYTSTIKYFSNRLYKETEFFSAIRKVINDNGWDYELEIERLAECNLLILDDVMTSQMTDWQKEVLFCMIDKRYESKLPLLMTSNLTIKQMSNMMGNKFTSRLCDKENIVIQLWDIDRRTGTDYAPKEKEQPIPQEIKPNVDKEYWDKKNQLP